MNEQDFLFLLRTLLFLLIGLGTWVFLLHRSLHRLRVEHDKDLNKIVNCIKLLDKKVDMKEDKVDLSNAVYDNDLPDFSGDQDEDEA